jgi:hypothetical protein
VRRPASVECGANTGSIERLPSSCRPRARSLRLERASASSTRPPAAGCLHEVVAGGELVHLPRRCDRLNHRRRAPGPPAPARQFRLRGSWPAPAARRGRGWRRGRLPPAPAAAGRPVRGIPHRAPEPCTSCAAARAWGKWMSARFTYAQVWAVAPKWRLVWRRQAAPWGLRDPPAVHLGDAPRPEALQALHSASMSSASMSGARGWRGRPAAPPRPVRPAPDGLRYCASWACAADRASPSAALRAAAIRSCVWQSMMNPENRLLCMGKGSFARGWRPAARRVF